MRNPKTILRLPEVIRRTGMGRSYIYKAAAALTFPKPIKIAGGRSSGWDAEAVDQWIARQLGGDPQPTTGA